MEHASMEETSHLNEEAILLSTLAWRMFGVVCARDGPLSAHNKSVAATPPATSNLLHRYSQTSLLKLHIPEGSLIINSPLHFHPEPSP
jgi:hypothetical protein